MYSPWLDLNNCCKWQAPRHICVTIRYENMTPRRTLQDELVSLMRGISETNFFKRGPISYQFWSPKLAIPPGNCAVFTASIKVSTDITAPVRQNSVYKIVWLYAANRNNHKPTTAFIISFRYSDCQMWNLAFTSSLISCSLMKSNCLHNFHIATPAWRLAARAVAGARTICTAVTNFRF